MNQTWRKCQHRQWQFSLTKNSRTTDGAGITINCNRTVRSYNAARATQQRVLTDWGMQRPPTQHSRQCRRRTPRYVPHCSTQHLGLNAARPHDRDGLPKTRSSWTGGSGQQRVTARLKQQLFEITKFEKMPSSAPAARARPTRSAVSRHTTDSACKERHKRPGSRLR